MSLVGKQTIKVYVYSILILWCNYTCHVIQVKEHFESSGYTAHGKPVDVQVTSDEETITVTVQSDIASWSVKRLQV